MPPVVSALLAFVGSLFRSRISLHLEHLALRHQLAVYQQTVHRPRLLPTDRLFWAWLSRLWPGWEGALAFVQPCTVMGFPEELEKFFTLACPYWTSHRSTQRLFGAPSHFP
jgi:hypothetical protein